MDTSHLPVDDGAAVALLTKAFTCGVNYIEIRYNDRRYNEMLERHCRLLGQVLGQGFRERVRVTVNLPYYLISEKVALSDFLRQCAAWLKTGRVDYLQFDGINRDTWRLLQESRRLEEAEKAVEAGMIREVGFSFRDQFLYLRRVVEGFKLWSFCRLQFSFMDVEHLPGAAALPYLAEAGISTVAGGPLKQGRLAGELPPEIVALLDNDNPAVQALTWVWNYPQVASAVVGMATIEEVEQNSAAADRAAADSLTVAEEIRISRVRDAYLARRRINCTGCRSCMPCPNGIDAPRIFELYNDTFIYDNRTVPERLFQREGHDVSLCNSCGECARRCGRSIDIPRRLEEAAGFFLSDK